MKGRVYQINLLARQARGGRGSKGIEFAEEISQGERGKRSEEFGVISPETLSVLEIDRIFIPTLYAGFCVGEEADKEEPTLVSQPSITEGHIEITRIKFNDEPSWWVRLRKKNIPCRAMYTKKGPHNEANTLSVAIRLARHFICFRCLEANVRLRVLKGSLETTLNYCGLLNGRIAPSDIPTPVFIVRECLLISRALCALLDA